ncbi:MAG: ATP-binding protein [Candidatus Methanoplasma sp.]|jgi:predicted AAA+ superfamily ATPase|nr:ATP-binding protein [Candidatus Methanoplasma sp.]
MYDQDELNLSDIRRRYIPRVVDPEIPKMLELFGAVLISGCKWCGKSWTGVIHSESCIFIGDPKNRGLAETDPDIALRGKEPRLVDEWQDVPVLWDTARHNMDLSGRRGMYIFTGSVTPPLGLTAHSGVGRFAPVKMRPMSLYESGDSNGAVSLSGLFRGEKPPAAVSGTGYEGIVKLICRGGWPAGVGLDIDKAMLIPKVYLDMIINYDFSVMNGVRRNPATVRRILRSLARNNATEARVSVLANDVQDADMPMSTATADGYLNILKNVFIIEEQEPWLPDVRSKTRLRRSPKRHFTDPSLAAAALKMGPEALLRDVETAGFLFKSLCYRDLCVYSAPFMGNVYCYRDSNDLEVDAIIEADDGRWAAIEIKLGFRRVDEAAANLIRLRDKIVSKGGVREPAFMMIICATAMSSYVRREDGIYVVPIDCLGP